MSVFEMSDRTKKYQADLLEFMESHIYTAEPVYDRQMRESGDPHFQPPIVEELTFRGLGYSLLARYGRWTAIIATGLAFALAHGLVNAFPLLAAFGIGLAYLRSRVDSVYPGMIVHGLFNAVALTVAVAGKPQADILGACVALWPLPSPF